MEKLLQKSFDSYIVYFKFKIAKIEIDIDDALRLSRDKRRAD